MLAAFSVTSHLTSFTPLHSSTSFLPTPSPLICPPSQQRHAPIIDTPLMLSRDERVLRAERSACECRSGATQQRTRETARAEWREQVLASALRQA